MNRYRATFRVLGEEVAKEFDADTVDDAVVVADGLAADLGLDLENLDLLFE